MSQGDVGRSVGGLLVPGTEREEFSHGEEKTVGTPTKVPPGDRQHWLSC